jgi:hypothetical protein
MFLVSDVITREYRIALPKGPFTFGYAVDASWCPPSKKPVNDPANDFPWWANAEDPWLIEYEQLLPICEENVGKHIFKVTVHHRGEQDIWGIRIFSWYVSTSEIGSKDETFAGTTYDKIDDFTTVAYMELTPEWWFWSGKDGKAIPGHHLGVIIATDSQDGNPDSKAEMQYIHGPQFIDIYVQE